MAVNRPLIMEKENEIKIFEDKQVRSFYNRKPNVAHS